MHLNIKTHYIFIFIYVIDKYKICIILITKFLVKMKITVEKTCNSDKYLEDICSIEMCDDCGHNDWVALINDRDDDKNNFMIFDGSFICRNCRELETNIAR